MISHFKIKAHLLPIVVTLLIIMQLIDPSRIWTSLLVLFGGAWLVAYLWVRSLSSNLRINREMRYGWAQVGDRLEERFTLMNSGSLPATWVEIQDQSTLPGYKASLATGVDAGGSNQWVTSGVCKQRGLYWLGNTVIRTGDPLGVYEVTIEDPSRTNLLVYPPVVPLHQINISPGGFFGEGKLQPNTLEKTVGASSVREYLPGDSLRTVHWKTSAKRESLFVRLFDGAPSSDWWILVDLQKAIQSGENENSTGEHAIILAASMADKGLQARQNVGLVVSGENLVWLPPQSGDNQRWDILRALALVSSGEIPLSDLLEKIRPNLYKRSSLLLITTNMEPEWLQSLVKLSWKGIVPTVILLDPASFGGVGNSDMMANTLGEMGIARYVIKQGIFSKPDAKPGHRGQWEWKITATGRAIPVRLPGDSTWRSLTG